MVQLAQAALGSAWWIFKPGFHIVVSVVSVVSVVRKKFIGQTEFILVQQVVSVVSFVLSFKLYLSYEFFSYDRHDRYDRYNDMETRPYAKLANKTIFGIRTLIFPEVNLSCV